MSTLAEFLTRCLDAAEAVAWEWPTDGHWGAHPNGRMWIDTHGHPIHAPRAWVLADVAAKRTVLTLHDGDHVCGNADHSGGSYLNGAACPTLLALAQPYRGEDGWREEWER